MRLACVLGAAATVLFGSQSLASATPDASAAATAPVGGTGSATRTAVKSTAKPATKPSAGTKVAAKATGKSSSAGKAGPEPVPDGVDVAASPPPAGSSPMADLKKSNDSLDRLLKKKYPAWSPEAEAQKSDVRRLVGGFLDYRELAHRSLAKHWDGVTPAQRQEFVSTLRELVERSYLKNVTGDPNYTMKYQKESTEGTDATVEATLMTTARGKKVNIALVYKLVHKDRWLVYDLITDEQSMLENYRAEFNKIINKDGFDALLKRMKKKLDEKDE